MFESVVELDAEATVAAFEKNHRTVVVESCRALVLAAHWADLHPGEACDPHGLPGTERPSQPGGAGTPEVAGFAAADIGCAWGTTTGAASRLIGDALDLRHRLPRCWGRVLNGEVPGHHARRVAQATRHLSPEAAARVDVEMVGTLSSLSFGRLATCLDAAVYKADPAAAEAEAELALRDRFVRLGRTSRFGMKLIIARASAGDALYFDAMIARLADILREQGDLDPLDIRRSKAVGILAQPAEAMRLLYEHAQPDEPDSTDEAEDAGATEDTSEDDSEDGDSAPADEPCKPDWDDEADLIIHDRAAAEDPGGPEPDPDAGYRSVKIIPPPFDPSKARPAAKIYVHLSAEALTAGGVAGGGVARMEGIGPVLLSQLRRLLGDHATIRLQPVIDLNDTPPPVDCYEIPERMREHLILTNPADRFPYAGRMARGPGRSCDIDHTIPYQAMTEGGPPGQTRTNKLGPLARFHHRVRTHGDMLVRQPEPGSYVWRTRYGRIYLVNNTGTHPLGAGPFARAIWQAADPEAAAGLKLSRLPSPCSSAARFL